MYLLLDLKKKTNLPADDSSMKVMMEWMKDIKDGTDKTREHMHRSILETNRAISERLDRTADIIGGLQGRLGEMTQIGPDIRRLSEVMASPKARGNFGEEMLENMLSQVLHRSHYRSQYKFQNGETVDMIITVGDKILPIDSKFSMENFRLYKEAQEDEAADGLKKAFLRDVKKRVDEIHKKYILPQEGTFDFALMYIPSEGVFQEAQDDDTTVAYARDKKVHFVSPGTLYCYLQIILLALRGQKVNEAAEQILSMIAGIKQESLKFGRNLEVLANHLKNAGNTMLTVTNDYGKLQRSIDNAATLKLAEEASDSIDTKLIEN